MVMDRRLLTHINWGLLAAMLLLFWVGIGNLYSASGVRVEKCDNSAHSQIPLS